MGTQSDIRDQRYRTDPDIGTSDIGLKCLESDIISDIGINFFPISYVYPTSIFANPRSAMVRRLIIDMMIVGSNLVRNSHY